MKKAIYSIVSLVIVWSSFGMAVIATPSQPSNSSLFSQARMGFGLAGEYLHSETILTMDPSATLGNIGSSQSQIGKKLQVAPNLELGTMIANDYYLGLVLSWRYSGAKNVARSPIRGANFFSHEFKINHYTDIMIKPGYKVTPRLMVYGLIGPSIASWSHTSNQFATQRLVDKITINKTSVGLGFGLGFEYLFEKNYTFSVDYTHHLHRSESKSQFIRFTDVTPQPPPLPPILRPIQGNIVKKVQPSYGTFAIRFTTFFSL